jgi:hypothetical protein
MAEGKIPTRLTIDAGVVAKATDIFELIEPVWWIGNFYETPDIYEQSLVGFTRPQRMTWAMVWYLSEVFNGGHGQFYDNSTGAVWADARAGFRDAGLPEIAHLIDESAARMGGSPSVDRDERTAMMDELKPDFADLDDALYDFLDAVDVRSRLLDYAKAKPEAFLFDGMVLAPPRKGLQAE